MGPEQAIKTAYDNTHAAGESFHDRVMALYEAPAFGDGVTDLFPQVLDPRLDNGQDVLRRYLTIMDGLRNTPRYTFLMRFHKDSSNRHQLLVFENLSPQDFQFTQWSDVSGNRQGEVKIDQAGCHINGMNDTGLTTDTAIILETNNPRAYQLPGSELQEQPYTIAFTNDLAEIVTAAEAFDDDHKKDQTDMQDIAKKFNQLFLTFGDDSRTVLAS